MQFQQGAEERLSQAKVSHGAGEKRNKGEAANSLEDPGIKNL